MERIVGSMRTPDGLWRVEAIRERGQSWYRIWYGDNRYADRLVIGSVWWYLEQAGVDLGTLVED